MAETVDIAGAPVDLNSVLRAEIAADIRGDGRAHSRFLQLLDRVYLSEFIEQTAPSGEKSGQLNLGSHTPVPQPWAPPGGFKLVPA